MKKYLDYKELNLLNVRVALKGYTPRTTLKQYADAYSRIVVGQGLKNAGSVRSYEESVKFLKRIYKENYIEFTKQDYEAEIKSLNEALKDWNTERKYSKQYRKRLVSMVSDSYDYLEKNISLVGISTETLLILAKEAEYLSRQDTHGSPSFFEYYDMLISEYRSDRAKGLIK